MGDLVVQITNFHFAARHSYSYTIRYRQNLFQSLFKKYCKPLSAVGFLRGERLQVRRLREHRSFLGQRSRGVWHHSISCPAFERVGSHVRPQHAYLVHNLQ